MLMSNGGPEGERRHGGRGLCDPCHATTNNKGELHKYPRSNRVSTDVLADFHALRAVHPEWNQQRIAEHMGISYAALRQVISRGTRARLGHRATPLKDAA
jgi:hypothetical protein